MEEHRELSHLSKAFTNVLKKMSKEWRKQFNEGLNYSQFQVLKILYEEGPQKVTELAEEMHVTPSAITGATDKLVALEYVERKGAKEDRRVVLLEVTEKGRAFLDSILENQKRVVEKFFEGLSNDDINHLLRIFNQISNNLDR